MRPQPKAKKGPQQAHGLAKVLHQSENAKDLVEECATELLSVNTDIKQELKTSGPLPGVLSALGKSEAIVDKVQNVSEKLAIVNDALEDQVRDRILLEHQFAAAVEQEESARLAALHDVLTDLPNRALFNDRLEHGLAQAIRHNWTLAVMFLDLNDFKKINDSYGHAAGDCVLKAVAYRLKEITRIDDTVSRYGGDEFLCLLMQARDNEHLAVIAQNMIHAIQSPCEVNIGDDKIHVSMRASIGIAIFPKDGATVHMLVKNADEAMYRAKHTKLGFAFAE